MRIYKIEDLQVWQQSRILCSFAYKLTKCFPDSEKFNLIKHLRENARAVPSNIAEGFYRFHYQDSIRFYIIARGCLGEMKSDLYLSFDQNYINESELNDYLQKIEILLIMLNSLIKQIKIRKTSVLQ